MSAALSPISLRDTGDTRCRALTSSTLSYEHCVISHIASRYGRYALSRPYLLHFILRALRYLPYRFAIREIRAVALCHNKNKTALMCKHIVRSYFCYVAALVGYALHHSHSAACRHCRSVFFYCCHN